MTRIIILVAVLSGMVWKEAETQTKHYKLKPTETKIKIVKPKNKIIKGKDEIKFFDEKGKVIKRISMKPEIKIEEVEVRRGSKTILKKQKIKKEIRKRAVLSKNGKFIGIVSNEHNIAVINEDGKEKSFKGEGGATGKITILDFKGKVLFEKKLSKNRWMHYKPLISDNAEYIVVFTQNESAMPPEGRDIIYVFDKDGKEVLTFPTEKEYKLGYRVSDIPRVISPNGRYLAIDIEQYVPNKSSPLITRFYDLKNNTFWDSGKRYVIFAISNNGIAKVNNPWDWKDKTREINLKEYLER